MAIFPFHGIDNSTLDKLEYNYSTRLNIEKLNEELLNCHGEIIDLKSETECLNEQVTWLEGHCTDYHAETTELRTEIDAKNAEIERLKLQIQNSSTTQRRQKCRPVHNKRKQHDVNKRSEQYPRTLEESANNSTDLFDAEFQRLNKVWKFKPTRPPRR